MLLSLFYRIGLTNLSEEQITDYQNMKKGLVQEKTLRHGADQQQKGAPPASQPNDKSDHSAINGKQKSNDNNHGTKVRVFTTLREDIEAFICRDPAARSRIEVVLCYPGLHAIWLYRIAHGFWRRRFYLSARMLSQLARWMTGVEIHPGAIIGRRCVIDHGCGVVIGETSEIGDDVTLYQGVTLGGIAPSVNSPSQTNIKRHPTLKNGVIVGSGAQILGPITIGEYARVGTNSVVTQDVDPSVTAVGVPAHVVLPRDRSETGRFVAYGTPETDCPDPVLATVDSLRGQVSVLVERIEELEEKLRGIIEHEDEASISELNLRERRPDSA